ncbi:MAG: BON domain-containing protein [Planctomycetota bacterium]
MPNSFGLQTNSPLGAGGSFRPNNSSFGSPLGLQTPTAGNNGNPFEEARADPQQQGRAGTQSTAGNRALNGQQNRRSTGFGNNTSGNRQRTNGFGQNAMNNFSRGQRGRNSSVPPPVITRIDFPVESVSPNVVIDSAREVLGPQTLPGIRDMNLQLNNGVAVLQGVVKTEREARLAAALLSLEPGIRSVDNQLVVQESSQ